MIGRVRIYWRQMEVGVGGMMSRCERVEFVKTRRIIEWRLHRPPFTDQSNTRLPWTDNEVSV
jgi:hypothetical protein